MRLKDILSRGTRNAADEPIEKVLPTEALPDALAEVLPGVLFDAFADTLERIVSGRRSFEDWHGIASESLDRIIAKTSEDRNLRYAGGKLCFSFADSRRKKVNIAYDLYFIDKAETWTKEHAVGDVYASNFTLEALAEIEEKGTVAFDIEGG
ncbi:hypothetical protein FACS1894167_14000 [Synergistales bacterium]|nr:hypothetical protein FACS1894167_14000 [Synergistales bacterium]